MWKWIICGLFILGASYYVGTHGDDKTPIWEDQEQRKYLNEWLDKKRHKHRKFYERKKH